MLRNPGCECPPTGRIARGLRNDLLEPLVLVFQRPQTSQRGLVHAPAPLPPPVESLLGYAQGLDNLAHAGAALLHLLRLAQLLENLFWTVLLPFHLVSLALNTSGLGDSQMDGSI